jgi:hypothetical protein
MRYKDQDDLPDLPPDDFYEDCIADEVRAFLGIKTEPVNVPVDYGDGRDLPAYTEDRGLSPEELRAAVGCKRRMWGVAFAFAGFVAFLLYLKGAIPQ